MKVSLLLLLLLPLLSFSQVYKFNRQIIITFSSEHNSRIDMWTTPLQVEVTKNYILLHRQSNGAGEKPTTDTLKVKDKNIGGKKNEYVRFKINDGRVLVLYADEYATMCTKETRDHKRVEYVFYNKKENEK